MIRGFAAAAVVACASLGLAGPAHADQLLQGVYTYTPQQGVSGTYQIWPSCVPVVGDLREPLNLPVACRLHVIPSEGLTGGDANLVGGIWELSSLKPDGMKCPDGSSASTIETIKLDDTTMTGTREIRHTDVCGLQPGIISIPFTLSYQGPLPIPVEQYPLYCEPAGLRICQ
ncbi:MAG: hypothetical protein NVSMB60_22860 [Mycobacterium sp.]